MKIISVGDIHGRPYWKRIDPSKYDKIIFNGDYVDAYDFSDQEIVTNLTEIIEFKALHQDKVECLLGNHDLQYMFFNDYPCSGFRPQIQPDLTALFYNNRNYFKAAFQIDNFIWTHAGISNKWYNFNKQIINGIADKFETKDLADTFNHMLWLKENYVLHQVSIYRQGSNMHGGITWADRRETSNDYLDGYHQFVGHTPINIITKYGDEKSSIRYIDVLGNVNKSTYEKPHLNDLFYEFELS